MKNKIGNCGELKKMTSWDICMIGIINKEERVAARFILMWFDINVNISTSFYEDMEKYMKIYKVTIDRKDIKSYDSYSKSANVE